MHVHCDAHMTVPISTGSAMMLNAFTRLGPPHTTPHDKDANMPQDAQPAAQPGNNEPTPDAKARWAAAFNRWMAERNLRNKDVVDLLDHPSYTRSMVSSWTTGRSGAAVAACLRIAEVFHLRPSEVLREAGHEEVAYELERIAKGVRPSDPASDPLMARVSELTAGLPPEQKRELRDSLTERVNELIELVEFRAAKLRAQQATRDDSHDADADGGSLGAS